MDKCKINKDRISTNIGNIIDELKKINNICNETNPNTTANSNTTPNPNTTTNPNTTANPNTTTNSTAKKVIPEIPAGYMGPQINYSNNRWRASLRNPYSF